MRGGIAVRFAGAAAAVILGSLGCSSSPGSTPGDAGAVDSGPDPSADAGPILETPPPRPMVADEPDGPERAFLLRDFVIDQHDDRWRTTGFDLDGLNSQEPDPQVECMPPSPSGPPEIDGERGIDNGFGHNVASLLLTTAPSLAPTVDAAVADGRGSLLLIVRGWSGERDDPRVMVVVASTVYASGDEAAAPDTTTPPTWDGEDYAYAREDAFIEGDLARPRVLDDAAYVAGGVLVTRLADRVRMVLGADESPLVLRMTDVHLTATISEDGRALERVVLGARVPLVDLLDETLDALRICPGAPERSAVERVLDLGADIRTDPGTGGPGVVCDALSLGLEARGVAAHFGGLVASDAAPPGCSATTL